MYVNSPHSFNEMSVTAIEGKDYYQLNRCDLDISLNSHDYPTEKSKLLVRRMNVPILEMKGLRNEDKWTTTTAKLKRVRKKEGISLTNVVRFLLAHYSWFFWFLLLFA